MLLTFAKKIRKCDNNVNKTGSTSSSATTITSIHFIIWSEFSCAHHRKILLHKVRDSSYLGVVYKKNKTLNNLPPTRALPMCLDMASHGFAFFRLNRSRFFYIYILFISINFIISCFIEIFLHDSFAVVVVLFSFFNESRFSLESITFLFFHLVYSLSPSFPVSMSVCVRCMNSSWDAMALFYSQKAFSMFFFSLVHKGILLFSSSFGLLVCEMNQQRGR